MSTPSQSKKKALPAETELDKETPLAVQLKTEQPEEIPKLKLKPKKSEELDYVPEESKQLEETPEESPEKQEKPSDVIEENCVMIGEQKVELKPTKLKYFRNKAASGYGIIRAVPLHELLTYGKGVLDESRDADQLLYDFLVAAFDDSTFVRDNYDNLDADIVDKIVKIFGRINHIDEKEEQARKNKEAQAKR